MTRRSEREFFSSVENATVKCVSLIIGGFNIETKSGTKTTEFYLVLIGANVAPILMALSGILEPKWAVACMAGANALYAMARGIAKHHIKPDESDTTVNIENRPR